MSSYLVALAVGDFECEAGKSDGIPIRVCGTPDRKGMGQFALQAAEFTLHFYNQYFGIKYPYGKLDFIGAPDFAAGAMENTGCIVIARRPAVHDPKTRRMKPNRRWRKARSRTRWPTNGSATW